MWDFVLCQELIRELSIAIIYNKLYHALHLSSRDS